MKSNITHVIAEYSRKTGSDRLIFSGLVTRVSKSTGKTLARGFETADAAKAEAIALSHENTKSYYAVLSASEVFAHGDAIPLTFESMEKPKPTVAA